MDTVADLSQRAELMLLTNCCSNVINVIKRVIFLAVLSGLWVGCETGPKPKPIAYLRPGVQGNYEIQLDASYRTCLRGPCHFPSLIPRTYYMTDWIYTRAIEGKISAGEIILTHERGKTDYPWPQEGLRGMVTFSQGHMRIALECPNYKQDGTTSRFVPYALNGDYILQKQ